MIIEFSVNENKSFTIRKGMKLFKKIILITIVAYAFSLGTALATTYYVDPNGSDDANGLSWPTAFETIQKAIDTASNTDVIDVNAGTYYESIDFSGKAVSIRSLGPDNPQVVAETVIDGNNADKVIIFDDSEDANSVISGFTIQGGGTGLYCFEASPSIYSCVIRDNNDSGIVNLKLSEPNIVNSVFYSNFAKYGAGIYNFQSSPKITSCIFSQNAASSRGGGIYNSFSCPVIINCTFSGNSASTSGGGMFSSISSAMVKNSVFWDNSAGYLGNEIYNDNSDPNFSYCGIENSGGSSNWDPNFGTDNGGNIDSNPWLFNADNPLGPDSIFNTIDDGLRLKASSACIDAADGNSAPSTDITGQTRIDVDYIENTGTGDPNYADIGAYEFSGDPDGDSMPDDWEIYYGLDPNVNDANDDPDNDTYSNVCEYLHGSNPNDVNSEPSVNITISVPYDINTIQTAINVSIDGDIVLVYESTYYEKINFNGKAVIVTSIDPDDAGIVANTIIDADDTNPDSYVVTFETNEDSNSVLQGITITGGYHGIYCKNSTGNPLSPLIKQCVIRNNAYHGIYAWMYCASLIENCIIRSNSQSGIYCNQYSQPTISNSRIMHNGSYGVFCQTAYPFVLENCIVAKNQSYGIRVTGASNNITIKNCAIVNNTSYGIHSQYALGYNDEITNCIIWGNGDDLYVSYIPTTYCCIEDGDEGLGNFTVSDPCFASIDTNDFHLDVNSLCIDMGEPWAEYSNEPSPNGGRLNLGAYGNTAEATITTDDDTDGLSDAWELHYFGSLSYGVNSNPDSDNFSNLSEYLFGYDPNVYTNEQILIIQEKCSVSAFDPTENESATVSYWINMNADVDVNFADATSSDVVRTLSESVSAGYNETVWYGEDDVNLIVLDGFYDIAIDADAGDGNTIDTSVGNVEVLYLHDVNNILCNPARIVPIFNEITKITYDLTVDADALISIYDPCDNLFVQYLIPENEPNEILWDGRNGPLSDPNAGYVLIEGEYIVEVQFQGMNEKNEGIIIIRR